MYIFCKALEKNTILEKNRDCITNFIPNIYQGQNQRSKN